MDNGIYIALSRQTTLFRDLEKTANNLSNTATTGYTADKLMFTQHLVNDGSSGKMAFTRDASNYRDTSSGPLKATGNPLDMAISGPGYFTIQTPLGNRYTKAGNFQIDGAGQLVTAEGNPVLDAGGQSIFFEAEDTDITVGESGFITVDGEERAQLGVVEFANEQNMQRLNGTMFSTNQAPQPLNESRVTQGVLQGSNVSPVTELVRLTKLERSTSNTAKYIEVMYDLQRKANTAYARANG